MFVTAEELLTMPAEDAVVSSGQLPISPAPPDLAVEVISPSDTYTEVDAKVLDWLRSGVRLVIVIDPSKRSAAIRRSMTATRLGIDDALDGGDVVPGWTLPLCELFE
jgi:Uma2 family endonuclease